MYKNRNRQRTKQKRERKPARARTVHSVYSFQPTYSLPKTVKQKQKSIRDVSFHFVAGISQTLYRLYEGKGLSTLALGFLRSFKTQRLKLCLGIGYAWGAGEINQAYRVISSIAGAWRIKTQNILTTSSLSLICLYVWIGTCRL